MTASPKTYLIAGATRGIGCGLITALLLKDNSLVIVGVRGPAAALAKSLEDLPKGKGSRLIVVKIDAADDTSAPTAIAHLQTHHSIPHLDIVIANAGITHPFTPMSSLALSTTRTSFEINTLGPLRLFQAVHPLLKPGARFAVTSSVAGSITMAGQMPYELGAYGMSKAAVNWFVSKAAEENPNIAITALHPGMVDTDMARDAIQTTGLNALTVEECVAGLVQVLEKPHEEVSGKFLDWKGEVVPW